MDVSVHRKSGTLRAEDIDDFSDWIGDRLASIRVSRNNRTRVLLLAEEMLLRLRDRFGEDTRIVASFDARFRRVRHPRLLFEVEGDPFNPLGTTHEMLGGWESSLRTAMGILPQYTYEARTNFIKIRIPHARMNSVLWIASAIALGVFFGLTGSAIIPASVRQTIAEVLFDPTYEMWIRLLNALSGPVVFLTVVTTMLNTQRIAQKGGSSLLVIARYFVLSFLVVIVALLFSLPFHSLGYVHTKYNVMIVQFLFEAVFQVIPNSIIEPFESSNTAQLLFLAFVLGCVLIRLGDRVAHLKEFVRESNMIGLQLAGWMGGLVPFFVGAFLCLEVWQGKTSVLLGLWKPITLALASSIATLVVLALAIAGNVRMSPIVLLRKIWPSFLKALKTGSLDESFDDAETCCTRHLGIDQDYTKDALPQGLVLYMPVSAIGTIVFTLYAAKMHNVSADMMWFVMAIVIAVVVFVATPPVPGANLLAYIVLFATLGIPDDALLDAMTFDIVFGVFAGAANQAMLQFEMVYQAARFGLLDQEVLRSPSVS